MLAFILEMKILIVDDDESLVTVYSTALKKEGFEIITAVNGQQGLEKAKEPGIDLILLDQVLPDISGNEILKTLKQDAQTKEIPVMILSNFSQEELVKQAVDEGAVDYVFKYQVELSDIIKKVKDVLSQPKSNPEPTEISSDSNGINTAGDGINPASSGVKEESNANE